MMLNKTLADRFGEAVHESFKFLLNKFGFVIKKENDFVFRATSINCCIKIYLDWPNIVVGIKPPGNSEGIGAPLFYNEIGLQWIIKYFDPDSDYAPKTLEQPEEIKGETDKLVTLLLKYCKPLLNGDFSQWSSIEEFVKKSLIERDQEHSKRINKVHINQVKERAKSAFREKHYQEAVELYKSIQKNLNPVEIKEMEYAKKITRGHPIIPPVKQKVSKR